MKETYEFRILEDNARDLLPSDVGEILGGFVRKITTARDDPIFNLLGDLERERIASHQPSLFSYWSVIRLYTPEEMAAASLLEVWANRPFEPAGEECGTVYDESAMCGYVFWQSSENVRPEFAMTDRCGHGARQINPLYLKRGTIPKYDFARTIASEIVVSQRVVDVFERHRLTGVRFDPVIYTKSRSKAPAEPRFQLVVTERVAEFAPNVCGGDNPFDERGQGRCTRGHSIGYNLLTPVTVLGSSVPNTDVCATRQLKGVHRGLLRPSPVMLMKPRSWQAIRAAGLTGIDAEVAYIE
jgi:hypothetical protein